MTPNIAIDRTLVVPGFQSGEVFRATRVVAVAGGKGINVARAVRTLGGTPLCAGFLGGHTGQLAAALAQREGLPGAWTWLEVETRTCVILVDPERGEATVINEPGPTVSAADWARLQSDVVREAARAEAVCLCGSLPPGSPPEAYAELIRQLHAAGGDLWVDTSGAALQTALGAAPVGIKVNSTEAGAILGQEAADVDTALKAASEMRRRGAGRVVLTLGQMGAVMVGDGQGYWAQPPRLKAVSPTGSGDAFLAGLLTARTRRASLPEALRCAVAAGAANALSVGGGQFELTAFHDIFAATQVRPLHPQA